MTTLILLLGCASLACAGAIVLLCALGSRVERNARRHRLGALLALSHPDWD